MASTILNFPDGSKEERRVISHFEVDGLNTLVFDMNKELNGNHCTHVSYLSPEGRYQNVVEPEKWDLCKGILVKALHGQAKENYRPVPAEISVTADPSRELYLRPANYTPLVENYENYLLEYERNPLGNETPIMNANEIQPITSDNVITADVQEVKIVDENTTNNDITEISSMASIPVEGTVVDNSNNDLNTEGYSLGNEMGIIPEIPSTPVIEQPVASSNNNENVIPFPEPILSTDSNINSQSSVNSKVESSVINETPIVSEIPSVPVIEQPALSSNGNENIIPFPEPILSTDSNINSQPSVNSEVSVINETPIVSEIPSTPVIEQPALSSNSNENVIPFPEPIMPTNINTASQINVSPEVPTVEVSTTSEENKSIVTDSYLGNANQIIENMKKISQEHQEKIKALDEEYIITLEEMKQQMIEHLKEAKDYGDILKGKFEAQNNMSQDGPSLQRVA